MISTDSTLFILQIEPERFSFSKLKSLSLISNSNFRLDFPEEFFEWGNLTAAYLIHRLKAGKPSIPKQIYSCRKESIQ
jgi:hypothetical protein